jgi:hypothetical protein
MHKLEYPIDYRHIETLFLINTEILILQMKVNPKKYCYIRVVYWER